MALLVVVMWQCTERTETSTVQINHRSSSNIPTLPPIRDTSFYAFVKAQQEQNPKVKMHKMIAAFSKNIDWNLFLSFPEEGYRFFYGAKEIWSTAEPTINVQNITTLEILTQAVYKSFLDSQFTIILYEQPIAGNIPPNTDNPPPTTIRLGRMYFRDFVSYSFEVNTRKKKAVEKYKDHPRYVINAPLNNPDVRQGQWDEDWQANPDLYPQEITKKLQFVIDEPIQDLMRDMEKNYIQSFTIHQYFGVLFITRFGLPEYPYDVSIGDYFEYLKSLQSYPVEDKPEPEDLLDGQSIWVVLYSDNKGVIHVEQTVAPPSSRERSSETDLPSSDKR